MVYRTMHSLHTGLVSKKTSLDSPLEWSLLRQGGSRTSFLVILAMTPALDFVSVALVAFQGREGESCAGNAAKDKAI